MLEYERKWECRKWKDGGGQWREAVFFFFVFRGGAVLCLTVSGFGCGGEAIVGTPFHWATFDLGYQRLDNATQRNAIAINQTHVLPLIFCLQVSNSASPITLFGHVVTSSQPLCHYCFQFQRGNLTETTIGKSFFFFKPDTEMKAHFGRPSMSPSTPVRHIEVSSAASNRTWRLSLLGRSVISVAGVAPEWWPPPRWLTY